MHTETIIQPFRDLAQRYVQEKRIKEILFSKGTYHVQVIDLNNQDPHWAFIQFDEHDHVQDSFCSCQTETGPACEHIAASLLKIYNGHFEPLHTRFEHSFWKHIFFAMSKVYGYETKILAKQEHGYELNVHHETVFSIHTQDPSYQKVLKEFIDFKKIETEETSLKFSKLSKKELELWKQGHPSESFRFELSFWADTAKWLIFLQEDQKPFKISVNTPNHLPTKIFIQFEGLDLYFNLSQEILKQVIPYLNSIHFPFKVHEAQRDDIEKVVYNSTEKYLSIFPKSEPMAHEDRKGYAIGDWIFNPQEGFYRYKPEIRYEKEEKILSHHIDEQLEKHASFFKKYLANTSLEIKPILPKYQVYFDADWNLIINLYLFEQGDLAKPHSVFFGKWIYIQDKGFFRLQESVFKQSALFIPKEKVSEFIHQYRLWFNSQKGFEVHLATMQAQISYDLNKYHQLIFLSQLSTQGERSHDFGEWIYIQGQGFYTKARQSSPIKNGLTINKNEIARFIQNQREELEQISHFFSLKCPVKQATIKLKVDAELQEILIEPEYIFYPEYQNVEVLFFEDFSYVRQEGFFQLPKNLLLPKGFRKKSKVLPHDQVSFLAFQFAKLKPFISYVDPKLQVPKNLNLVLKSHSSPYTELAYQSATGSVSINEIRDAFEQGHPYYFSDAGLIQINHPRYCWIQDLKKEDVAETGLKLSSIDIIRIEAIDSAFSLSLSNNNLLSQIFAKIDLTLPSLQGFKTKLRPYQQIGLEWLWKLYNYNLSGILCDDMGLGKTLQAMALMASIKSHKEKKQSSKYSTKKKFLIVCPTSVTYHWQDKLREFYPQLKILTYYGLNRSLQRFQQQFDVLLTSYGILRIDQKLISKFNYTLAIFDEVQVAKNHRSLTYTALEHIPSRMKLGLTGTPIENNLRELKAIMDLIIPSYLPKEEQYRDFFINPIERDKDENKIKILKKMIEPFILRRKKEDVLKELPKKTEQVAHCELSSEQAKLYNFFLNQTKEALLAELQDNSKPIPYIHIFALLNKLKQVCNHPKSIDPQKYSNSTSGKWELFIELLQEARDSGQKVVVFSQYLNMLDIIEEYLTENQIKFASVRGSTKNRKEELNRFQTDPTCEVFVGSLKAVGLGVDLTAASVVIHYDRWWNAARENQATDRVHRIGQQRGVQVFKMVTLNTLEEKIAQIISAKGKLMEEIVSSSDHNQIKAFSREDLIEILQFTHKEIYQNS